MDEVHLADILEALRLGKGRPSRVKEDPESNTGILRLGAVDYDSKRVNWDERMRVSDLHPSAHHFLRSGDILIVGRGVHRTALLADDPPPQTVADRTFFVARPDMEQVEPAFLAWYLNERRAQHYLQSHSRGTNIQTIKKSALERLPVQVPPLDTQERIADIQALVRREQKLVSEWMNRRSELARAVMAQKLKTSE
ncbi:restriction endonuclease subunit S [Salinibacter sp.]|uniref:restriction endonuclease subunit S n=1 Tax=Salinibacter sp. TaxID=2065818 RepID=UPI0021E908A9|nr:restriction endonuclease subunit S [Salinibacter sp.]